MVELAAVVDAGGTRRRRCRWKVLLTPVTIDAAAAAIEFSMPSRAELMVSVSAAGLGLEIVGDARGQRIVRGRAAGVRHR